MRFYFDMDGVLAKWNSGASLEEVAQRGYFLHREPEPSIMVAVLYMFRKGFDVTVLSAAFQDDHSVQEKSAWLDMYGLKGIPRIFVPYGQRKGDYVKEEGAILVDDFTKNLQEWDGIPVKFYNGINGTKGTYFGYSISNKMTASQIVTVLKGIAMFNEAA